MNSINRIEGELCVESVPCRELAEQFGTPLFVYSKSAIEQAWRAFDSVLKGRPHLVCYAMKANSNLAILQVLAKLGSGFDIVSGGELQRVKAAGGDMQKVVFSGVGKSKTEMAMGLESSILCFNVESLDEITQLEEVAAAHGVIASVSVRVNPDVDAKTHPYISTGLRDNKFGIPFEEAVVAYRQIAESPFLASIGMDCHIGSQLTDISPYKDALNRLLALCDMLENEGIHLKHLDLGGGQGIRYKDEDVLDLSAWADAMFDEIGSRNYEIIVEPGRSIVGNAGLLLTRVSAIKSSEQKNFAIVDAAMNDLIRPALYSAWQEIVPVSETDAPVKIYDVVGPVCESADFLGRDRALAIARDQFLAIMSAGAYSFCMSSNYNSRPRAAEVMVDGQQSFLIRQREDLESLYALESMLE